MSGTNVHPPQTYSRLFRPWDTYKCSSEMKQSAIKNEGGSCATNVQIIKTEITNISSNNNNNKKNNSISSSDSDREECALSSSSKSSFDESFHISDASQPTKPPSKCHLLPDHCASFVPDEVFDASSQHLSALEHQHRMQLATISASTGSIPASSDIFYTAAQSAAINGLPLTTTSAFGMDPYTLSLMEQEYARVMAEDAHLKALNARKQRPKKFKCPHCDVAFSNNGQLRGHIRIHTGERPFKCDVETCGKTFTRNEELTRHKRIHTGLRPYPCTACGKKFGRRDHLKKHMKTHMPQERQLGPAIFVPMYPYLYGY